MTCDKTQRLLYQAIVIIVHEPHIVSFCVPFALHFNDCQMSSFLSPPRNYRLFIILFFGIATVKSHRSGTFHRVRTCEALHILKSMWRRRCALLPLVIYLFERKTLERMHKIHVKDLAMLHKNCRLYLALRECFSLIEKIYCNRCFLLYKKKPQVNSEWNTKELFCFPLFLLLLHL